MTRAVLPLAICTGLPSWPRGWAFIGPEQGQTQSVRVCTFPAPLPKKAALSSCSADGELGPGGLLLS